MSIRLGLLAAAGAVLAASSASATVFDFTAPAAAHDTTPTTFDGATFTSPVGSYGFKFGSNASLFSTLAASVLSAQGNVEALKITFSAPVTSYALHFALGDPCDLFGGDTLTVTPNVGAAKTYATTIPGGDYFPQGVVSATGVDVTSLTLTSPEPIVISNLVTTAASVPEPVTVAVLGAGLLGLFGARRRS